MAQIQRPLTTEEAAEYLQVTVDTVRRYIREGRLKALQLGRGYRIRLEDLDAFLAGNSGDRGQEQAAQPELANLVGSGEEFESWVDLMKTGKAKEK
jgi:excisionase family DNA binding protein